ncbi:MAG: methyl-accepting chemotaxis protein [Halopseudomonas sp.]
MNTLLSRLNVRNKIMLLVALMTCALIIMQAVNLNALWKDLNHTKQVELKSLTDIAYSLIERQVKLVNTGEKSKQEGIEEALADLSSLRYGNGDYFFVLDKQHTMLMHPIKPSLNGKNVAGTADPNGKLLFQEMIKGVAQNGETYVEYMWERAGASEPIDKLSYARLHPKWGWVVATGVYTDDIKQTFNSELRDAAVSLAAILVAAIIIGYVLANTIAAPITSLKQLMIQASSEHNLTLRSDINSRDEVGEMAQTFNAMLSSFDGIIADVAKASQQVSQSATELSTTTAQTLTGMQDQRQETVQVAAAITQMSSTVQAVATNTENTAKSSHDASRAADSGKTLVKEALDAVNALAAQLDQAGQLTTQLKEESSNIATILEVINTIANQTNLLALNAAIEAARAGEQGRGFAVVADEVRTLAQRTAESTQEIQQVIDSLQQGVENAAGAMSSSHDAAIDVVNKASRADTALDEIVSGVITIDEMTRQIASAAEQQSAVTNEISTNIIHISDVSDECATATQQVTVASEELAQLSEQLKGLTDRFRVSA